ncbi:MAG: MFS transporter [Propionicimonas sp.]|nr:MFS transporter [Propionicimonas sp.]
MHRIPDPRRRGREELSARSARERLPLAVWIVAVVGFFIAIGFGVMSPVLPVYARAFGVSTFLVGLVVSSLSIVRLASMPLAGSLLTRVGPRELAIAGNLLLALTTALIGFSNSYAGVLVWRGLGGFGSALYGVSSMALVFKVVPPHLRGRANALTGGGFVLGGMAGPALGGLLSGVSIHFPFFFYAVTLICAAAVMLVFLPATQPPTREQRSASQLTLRAFVRDPRFRASLAMNFANGWQSNGVRALVVPLFVIEVLGQTTAMTGVAFAVAALAQACCLPLTGWAVDHLGRRTMLLAGASVTTVIGALVALAPSFPALVVLLCVYAVGASAAGSAAQALLADTVPATAGSALSAYQMAGDSGMIVGPLVAGAIIDVASMPVAMGLGSVLFVAAGWLAWRVPGRTLPPVGSDALEPAPAHGHT